MKQLFQQKGYWNGEPTALFTACIIRPKENTERPLHWYNPFSGQEMQAIEITYGGQTWAIYNQDGTGYYKVTKGMGSPQCGHASFDAGYEFVRYITETEMIKAIDNDLIAEQKKIIEAWQIEKDPVGFEKMQQLLKWLQKFQSMTIAEKIIHIFLVQ